mmetsp:Transcript_17242/g.49418  ORF Transcript_17242/g.49418 Transcript_17242/m.49418 type:complete len:716 (-) Transcript_17242:107-2254(-)
MRRQMKSKDEGDGEQSQDGAEIRNDDNSAEVETVAVTPEVEESVEEVAEATDTDTDNNTMDATSTETTPCTMCTDEPSPYMIMTGKTCPDVYLQQKCANDPTNNWQEHQYCTQTCSDLGIGYDGVECCDPSSLPPPTTTDAPTGTPTSMPTDMPTPSPSLSPTLSPTTEEPTASPSASPVSDPPTTSPSSASPTDAPSLSPTTKEPSAGPTAAPSTASPTELPTPQALATTEEPTASLTVASTNISGSPTASPSTLVSSETQPDDVAGEDRIDLLHNSNSDPSDDKKNREPMQPSNSKYHVHSKKSKSGDEVQNNVPKYQFSPGCSSVRRGEIFTRGEQITIAFKYMVLYDGELDLSHLLVGLEDNLQTYAEQSMINCPGASSYVVNNGATWIDGVQIDLPSQPEAGCGVDENDQTCSMLDGYVTIYIRQTAEVSGLAATQDALKALRVGMTDGLVRDTDGISELSFLGGISVEGDGLGHGTPDNIPASARIGSAPLGNMPEEGSGLSALGIGLLVVAAIGFVLIGAALRRRVRFRLKKRALADSDSDASLDNEVRSFDAGRDDEIEQRDSTVGQSFAESLASCHGDTPAACGAQDSSDDESIAEDKLMRANTASFDIASSGGGMQSIAIHQYCEAPTCTICRSYKKPMFANMKYKVEDTGKSTSAASETGETNSVRDEERDDCDHRRYEACPTTGIVAKTFAKLSSGSDCYLCA